MGQLPRPGRRSDIALALLVVVVLGLQVLAINQLEPDVQPQGFLRRAIFLSPALLIPALLWRFPSILGAWIIAAGITLNLLPMAAHGGLMPVALENVAEIGSEQHVTEDDIGRALAGSKNVLLWRADIRFEVLSDRFQSQQFGLRPAQFSAGDATELMGVLAAAIQLSLVTFRPSRPVPNDGLAV